MGAQCAHARACARSAPTRGARARAARPRATTRAQRDHASDGDSGLSRAVHGFVVGSIAVGTRAKPEDLIRPHSRVVGSTEADCWVGLGCALRAQPGRARLDQSLWSSGWSSCARLPPSAVERRSATTRLLHAPGRAHGRERLDRRTIAMHPGSQRMESGAKWCARGASHAHDAACCRSQSHHGLA